MRHDVPNERYVQRAKAEEFACVGSVAVQGKPAGSCVLISPHWAITDAHVVKTHDAQDLTASFDGKAVRVKKLVIHPDYEGEKYRNEPSGLGRKGVDLALLMLEASPTASPGKIARGPIKVGTEISVAGFGVWGVGDSLGTNSDEMPQKRAGTNVVDSIGGNFEGFVPDLYYVTDFDSSSGDKNRCGSASPTDLECLGIAGDSGGGAFVN